MSVGCECCVLSGRSLCDELITHPEVSYRLCCLAMCDLQNLVNEEVMALVGPQHQTEKNSYGTTDVYAVLRYPKRRYEAHTCTCLLMMMHCGLKHVGIISVKRQYNINYLSKNTVHCVG